jgi:excisionase family DNA binding protein
MLNYKKLNEMLSVDEVAEKIGVTSQYVRKLLRDRTIQGTKVGKEWKITSKAVNKFLGIEKDDEEIQREIYIKQLEGEVNTLKIKIQAFKSLIESASNMIR